MKRLLLLLLLIPSLAFSAITEHYVTTTGTDTWANCTSSGTPCSWATMLTNAVAGDRVNVKVGTYSQTSNVNVFTNSGTATSPIIVRGYSSTIGDGYLGRTNGNGALITTNMPLISYTTTGRLNASGETFILLESIQLTSASSNPALNMGADSALKSCVVTDSSANAAAVCVNAGGARDIVFDNDITMTAGSGGLAAIQTQALNARIVGNRINGGSAIGIRIFASNATTVIAMNTIFTSSDAIHSVDVGTSPCVLYNTLVGGSIDGFHIDTGNGALAMIVGNMLTDNTGDGIDMVSTGNAAFTAYNRFRDNANTYANAGDWITATNYGAITSGAGTSDYVGGSGSSGDYRLLYTSPGFHAGQPAYASLGALEPATPTPTPTATATATSTATATATTTATATATFTPTPSATVNCPVVCPTATATPTLTPTATATATATSTATSTPTPVVNNEAHGF